MPTNDVENTNGKEIYDSPICRGLFSEELEGCCNGAEAQENQHILNESKTRQKNLAMSCIDYKKAYDMVPPS